MNIVYCDVCGEEILTSPHRLTLTHGATNGSEPAMLPTPCSEPFVIDAHARCAQRVEGTVRELAPGPGRKRDGSVGRDPVRASWVEPI